MRRLYNKNKVFGGEKLKRLIVWAAVVVFFITIAIVSSGTVYEDKVKEDYYELLVVISDLFKDHAQAEEEYYNQSYPTEKEIAKLLKGKVTDRGFQQVVETFFEERNDLFVYNQTYQEYLNDTLDFSNKQKEANYYRTVRNTILNPALRLITFDQLIIEQNDNKITVVAEEVEVKFYNDSDENNNHHQYARFGFPPKDIISFSLTFIYEDEINRLDEFKVESQGI